MRWLHVPSRLHLGKVPCTIRSTEETVKKGSEPTLPWSLSMLNFQSSPGLSCGSAGLPLLLAGESEETLETVHCYRINEECLWLFWDPDW